MTFTAYRIHSGFCDVIDIISLIHPTDSNASYDELRLILPARYTVGETEYGEPAIYDEAGNPVNLCLNNCKGNAVIAVSKTRSVGLKKVPEDRELVKLQEARFAAGMTVKQLSEVSGVNARQIQRVELGEAEAGNMTARNLLALADALGVELRSLI